MPVKRKQKYPPAPRSYGPFSPEEIQFHMNYPWARDATRTVIWDPITVGMTAQEYRKHRSYTRDGKKEADR